VVGGVRQSAALEVALDVAERAVGCRDIADRPAATHDPAPSPQTWRPYSVAAGDAGLAVLCSYLDRCFPRAGWDATGDKFLRAALRAADRSAHLSAGLFAGISGLNLTATLLHRHDTHDQHPTAALDAELASRISLMTSRLHSGQGLAPMEGHDVVSGVSGVATGLLAHDPYNRLPEVLGALVWLAARVPGPPRWATPPERLVSEPARRFYPYGKLDCGLAHGLPGPLSALALALLEGHEVPGQSAAVRHMADWLVEHRSDDEWGVNWPSAIPLSDDRHPPVPGRGTPARSAWCYGAPGVAHALWLAGTALDDRELHDVATEAMAAVLRRPAHTRFIDSPTFCHGVAGLLQIVLRFGHATRLPFLRDAADPLVEQLLAAYEPDRPWGYAALDPGNDPVDRPGLVDGAAGVALVLLAAATDVAPTWDRLFLLS
jgi:Lantibiotic modifying enzyme